MATLTVYGLGMKSMLAKTVNWTGDTLKLSLHTSAYVPDQDAHQFFSSATNELAAGSGYTAGGIALANKTSVYTAASNLLTLDADDVTWTAPTFTGARIAVLRVDTGTASTSPLLCWVDFGADQSPGGVDFTVSWNASGIITLTC